MTVVSKQVQRPAAKSQLKKVAPAKTLYAIGGESRPSHGREMFAHTHAVLRALNMLDSSRPSVASDLPAKFLGSSAVNYHIGVGNFEERGDKIRLSVDGVAKFNARVPSLSLALVTMYSRVISTGLVKNTTVSAGDLVAVTI